MSPTKKITKTSDLFEQKFYVHNNNKSMYKIMVKELQLHTLSVAISYHFAGVFCCCNVNNF